MKIFKSSGFLIVLNKLILKKKKERILYKKVKEKLKKIMKNEVNLDRSLVASSEDDDFDLKYDSDSIKSTESIHEARKKIENPRKIISLLNNLNQINLNDPMEKAEFLKNIIDFEEKYGKLDEEEIIDEGPISKRSKHSDKNKNLEKNQEIVEEKKEAQKQPPAIPEVVSNKESEKQEIKETMGILEKIDNLKKNYDEFMNSERVALESLVAQEEINPELKINEKDLLFLTNPEEMMRTDFSKPTEEVKTQNSVSVNKFQNGTNNTNSSSQEKESKTTEKDLISSKDKTSNAKEKTKEKEKIKEQHTAAKENKDYQKNKEKSPPKLDNQEIEHEKSKENNGNNSKKGGSFHKKDKSISRVQEQEEKRAKESFHSKNSKISKDSRKIAEEKNGNEEEYDENALQKSPQKNRQKVEKLGLSKHESPKSGRNSEINSPKLNEKTTGIKTNRKRKDSEENDSSICSEEELFDENQEAKNTGKKATNKKETFGLLSKGVKKTTPALDLKGLNKKERERNSENSEEGFKIEKNEQSNLEGSQFLEEGLMKSSQDINNNMTDDLQDKKQITSENTEERPFQDKNMGTLSSSRNDFDTSKNMEEEYEMIEDDIMDEDLEVLIKTSEKNEVLNEFKTEGAKEEMSKMRKKLIHKLEKKYGKKNFQKKLKEIEKNIENASKLEQVFNIYCKLLKK